MATIYIVDDRPINRQFLVTLLGYSGHKLAEASDGVEALALVQERIPDLIILDIVMPNMDGREFVVRLKADPKTAAIPVIFYTATYRSEEARSIARSCGVRWVLPKPSEPQLILATVTESLGLEGGGAAPGTAFVPPLPAAARTAENLPEWHDLNERMTRLTNESFRHADRSGHDQLVRTQAMTLKLVALVELGIDIGTLREPALLVNRYCRAAQDILTAKYAAIGILGEGGTGLRYFAMNGVDDAQALRLSWPTEPRGALAQALAGRRPVRMKGLAGDATEAGLPRSHPPINSLLVVPLLLSTRTYGWLYVADRLGYDDFCMDDERLAATIGAQFSLAFENIDLYDDLQLHMSRLQQETSERLQAMEALREREKLLIHQSRQAAMGEMINNIAHQWRQPLNNLGLIVQQLPLLREPGLFSEAEIDNLVARSMELISHMSQTIDDFRNFFHPDKERVLFKVNHEIAKTVSLVEASFRDLQIRLETTAQGDPLIYGFPNEYSQVLLNILSNARDVLEERKIDDPRVIIESFSENDMAVLTVRDNADGIRPEIMEKIFDPYFTTKAQDRGTGVGLFMSKTIVEKNMHGRLTARNTTDGAEFRIEIPSGSLSSP